MLKEYWELTKQKFKKDKTSEYSLWIEPIKYISSTNKELNLSVPNIFVKERIIERYIALLKQYLNGIAGENIKINLSVEKEEDSDDEFDNIEFDREDHKRELLKKVKPKPLPFLNPKHTFDRYIIGDHNNLASIAAKKVISALGKEYNPFFIYGGVGLGKTHLVQAMAHAVHEQDPTLKIVYVTSEQLLNDYVNSLRSKSMHHFRLKYRSADVLLIDDIQFLENTDKTQEELFHIYNALKNEAKQMVFTSDRAPSKLNSITDRLISRFKSGLVVEIKKPSLEMRKKIIKYKLDEYNISVNQEIIDYIASKLKNNIRDIESTINRIRFLYNDMGIKEITIESIKSYINGIVDEDSEPVKKEKRVSVEDIQRIVAKHFNINYSDMKSKKRTQAIVFPRQIAMCISRELTSLSTGEIGSEFGGRNHSTVIFAVEKIKKQIDSGKLKANEYEDLKKKIIG